MILSFPKYITEVTPIPLQKWSFDHNFAWRSSFEWLLFHFSSRTDSKQFLPQAGKPHSHSWKNCKYHVHYSVCNEILRLPWRNMCMQFELTEVARPFLLDPTAWEWGYPLSGLGTKLLTYLIIHLIPCVKLYHCSECPCSLWVTSSMCTDWWTSFMHYYHQYPLSVLNVRKVLNAVSIAHDHHMEPWLLLLLVPFP